MKIFRWVILCWSVAVCGVCVPVDADFVQRQVLWQQVEHEATFALTLERQVYSTLDRTGRFVMAVQVGHQGPDLKDMSVTWSVTRDDNEIASGTSPIEQGLVCIDFDIAPLQPGRFDVSAALRVGEKMQSEDAGYFLVQSASAPAQSGRFALRLPRGTPKVMGNWPMHFGVPMPKGALVDPSHVRVVDSDGLPIETRALVRSRWGAGDNSSVRWLGLDTQLPATDQSHKLFVEYGPEVRSPDMATPLRVTPTATGYIVDTGPLQLRLRREGFNLFDSVTLNGKVVLSGGAQGGAFLVDHQGAVYRAANDKQSTLTIEEHNDLRVVLRADGWFVRDGSDGTTRNFTVPTDALCKFTTRIEAYAGKPFVRVLHSWVITYDSFSVHLADVGMNVPLALVENVSFGVENADPVRREMDGDGLYLIQHKPDRFDVESVAGKHYADGMRSDGTLIVTHDTGVIGASLRDMWQRFPNEFEAKPTGLTIHLWPAHGKDHPEIDPFARDHLHQQWYNHQGHLMDLTVPWDALFAYASIVRDGSFGIYKPLGNIMAGVHSSAMGTAQTADMLISFGQTDDSRTVNESLAAHQTAPHALADPAWLSATKAMGYVHPYDPEHFAAFERTLSDYQKGYWKSQNETGIYGKWLYRGWHHTRYKGEGEWELYRIYSAGHHHEPYMPWLLYARSGDADYLTIAQATSRSFADFMMLHYNDPNYAHREFNSRQGRLVGSTKHTNGHVLWGGDHAVFGHLTTYRALLTAYYMTGDLRYRQVLVDEWQKTITEDRANPEFSRANRIKGLGRDNNNSLGELIELYQLTYNPALLAWIGPATARLEQHMKVWGFPLESVLLFSGDIKVKEQLLDVVARYRAMSGRPENDHGAFTGHSSAGVFALAHLVAPQFNYAADAYLLSEPSHEALIAKKCFDMVPDGLQFYTIPDYVLYIPRVLYAIANSKMASQTAHLGNAQSLPVGPSWDNDGYLRIVLREDVDQDIRLHITGKIGSEQGVTIQIFSPSLEQVARYQIDKGSDTSDIIIPADGHTGQYVVFLRATDGKDQLLVPISKLPEVYHAAYWSQPVSSRFFTRTGNLPDGVLSVKAHKGSATLYDAQRQNILDQTQPPESRIIQVDHPDAGVWIETESRYVHMTDKLPIIFSVSPSRFFVPGEQQLELTPVK